MAEPPQKKRPNFTDEEVHALISAVVSRKEVLFSKFGGKIKFSDYRATVKKADVEKKSVGGTGKYCNLKSFQFKLKSGLSSQVQKNFRWMIKYYHIPNPF